VPGVGIDDELAVRESLIEVDRVLGRHHPVALAVREEHGLVYDTAGTGEPLPHRELLERKIPLSKINSAA
jgi:hypothetical protein